jgi:heme A synthase
MNYVKLSARVMQTKKLERERNMRRLKDICGLLLSAAIVAGIGQFIPGLNLIFDNYLVGFILAAIAIPVVRMMYRAYMTKVSKLPPDMREKREKEGREWWKETSEATYSPSRVLDLRNMTNDD